MTRVWEYVIIVEPYGKTLSAFEVTGPTQTCLPNHELENSKCQAAHAHFV